MGYFSRLAGPFLHDKVRQLTLALTPQGAAAMHGLLPQRTDVPFPVQLCDNILLVMCCGLFTYTLYQNCVASTVCRPFYVFCACNTDLQPNEVCINPSLDYRSKLCQRMKRLWASLVALMAAAKETMSEIRAMLAPPLPVMSNACGSGGLFPELRWPDQPLIDWQCRPEIEKWKIGDSAQIPRVDWNCDVTGLIFAAIEAAFAWFKAIWEDLTAWFRRLGEALDRVFKAIREAWDRFWGNPAEETEKAVSTAASTIAGGVSAAADDIADFFKR